VPLGGVLVGDPIYDTFVQRPYPGGLTYAGHPLACAAAVGTLRAMHDEDLVASAARLGRDVLGPGLRALAEQHPSVGEVRGIGALWTLELVRDRMTREPLVPYAATGPSAAPMAALGAACLDRGLITFVFGNRINVAPPLNLSDAEAADGLAILDEVLSVADAPPRQDGRRCGEASIAAPDR
jgi:taurine---2-oxoglutarate transaminase